jgi:hypothetical protein
MSSLYWWTWASPETVPVAMSEYLDLSTQIITLYMCRYYTDPLRFYGSFHFSLRCKAETIRHPSLQPAANSNWLWNVSGRSASQNLPLYPTVSQFDPDSFPRTC